MNTRQSAILVLLLFVVASGWFLRTMETVSPPGTAAKRGPDMFAGNIVVTVMDQSGLPAYRITAEQLQHLPEAERFDLTRPSIHVSRTGGITWKIASEFGQMNDKGDRLWFLGEANIDREGGNALHIRSSDILVKPDEELAETESAVSISSAFYEIQAIGLRADFRNRLLELRSRVRGTVNATG